MALAEMQHPTGTEKGQGRGGGGRAVLGAMHIAMDVDDGVPAVGGSQPDQRFAVSGPQKMLQRTWRPVCPLVALVPQLAAQIVEVLLFCSVKQEVVQEIPEVQVVERPRPPRAVLVDMPYVDIPALQVVEDGEERRSALLATFKNASSPKWWVGRKREDVAMPRKTCTVWFSL